MLDKEESAQNMDLKFFDPSTLQMVKKGYYCNQYDQLPGKMDFDECVAKVCEHPNFKGFFHYNTSWKAGGICAKKNQEYTLVDAKVDPNSNIYFIEEILVAKTQENEKVLLIENPEN